MIENIEAINRMRKALAEEDRDLIHAAFNYAEEHRTDWHDMPDHIRREWDILTDAAYKMLELKS